MRFNGWAAAADGTSTAKLDGFVGDGEIGLDLPGQSSVFLLHDHPQIRACAESSCDLRPFPSISRSSLGRAVGDDRLGIEGRYFGAEKMKWQWRITGYDSLEKVYERPVPLSGLSEKGMVCLLSRLAARHLSDDEVVSSSLRRNNPGYSPHLEIHRDARTAGRFVLMTGGNPHYTARAVAIDVDQGR